METPSARAQTATIAGEAGFWLHSTFDNRDFDGVPASPAPAASDRAASESSWPPAAASLLPPPTQSMSGTTCPACPRWTEPRANPYAATNGAGPGNWSTSTSRSSAASLTAAATRPSAVRPVARARSGVTGYAYLHTALDDHTRLAYTEDLPTKPPPPAPVSLPGSPPGSTRAASRPNGPSPSTPGPTARAPVARPSTTWASAPAGPVPGDRRPTERSNASSAPCSTNGPTTGPTPWTTSGRQRFPAGWTGTTATDPTPASAATHQPAASSACPRHT